MLSDLNRWDTEPVLLAKWHLGGEGFHPDQQGFDQNHGGHHRGSPPGGYYAPYKNPRLTSGPDGEYLPDRLTNEAIQFIESKSDRPFLDGAFVLYRSHSNPGLQTAPGKIQTETSGLESQLDQSEGVPGRSILVGASKGRITPPTHRWYIAMDENVGRILNAALEKTSD